MKFRFLNCFMLVIYIIDKSEVFCSDGISCSFKDNFCQWTIHNSSGIAWKRYQYRSPLSKTGPTQTYGNDSFYIYFDTSNMLTVRGSYTTLVSPFLTNVTNSGCVRFYYHMYGDTMGSLSFGMTLENNTENIKWTKNGNQGESWHCMVLSFKGTTKEKIFFNATRGEDINSFIALDNITLFTDFTKCTDCSDFFTKPVTTTYSTAFSTITTPQQTLQSTDPAVPADDESIIIIVLYIVGGIVGVTVIGIIILAISLHRHRRKMRAASQQQHRMDRARENLPRPSLSPSEKYTDMPGGGTYEELKIDKNVYDYIDHNHEIFQSSAIERGARYSVTNHDADYVDPSNGKLPDMDPERRSSLLNMPPLQISTISQNPRESEKFSDDYMLPI